MDNHKISDKTVEYYESTYFDYVVGLGLWQHLGLHYGYWDKNIKNHKQAIQNLNRVLANKLLLKPGMRVLDAGCGVGGSSMWLASNYDIHVTGITLSPSQVKYARKFAKKRGLESSTDFLEQDYCHTQFGDGEFDVVWAIESVCYAENKSDFLREAYRVLKPGGQLIISDGFSLKSSFEPNENRMMRRWLDGWAVPSIAYFGAFSNQIIEAGFEDVKSENVTKNVLRFSKWLHNRAKLAYPIAKILEVLKVRTNVQTKNVSSAIWQYRCIKEGLCGYGIFTARKPV